MEEVVKEVEEGGCSAGGGGSGKGRIGGCGGGGRIGGDGGEGGG